MPNRQTEAARHHAAELDVLPLENALTLLADAQAEAARTVAQAVPALARAAEVVAETLRAGGKLIYAAAGSSGLMALADALELPGTFGIPKERVLVLLAGGTAALTGLLGGPEDDEAQGHLDVADAGVSAGDCLIALSASGSTPYALGALRQAVESGARTVAFANNADAPMLQEAEIGVLLATPPEVLAGSTRMGAGTAQKIALNMLSTAAAIRLGHVHGPFMVNLRADNAKLQSRAARMVAEIAGVAETEASMLLDQAGGSVKEAVLLGLGADSAAEARDLLDSADGRLRLAMNQIARRTSSAA